MPSLRRRLFDSLATAVRGWTSRRTPPLLEIDDIAAYRRPAGRRAGAGRTTSIEDRDAGLAPCSA